jgi:hypothetical protein
MRLAGATPCVWGELMLKFEDRNKGPRRLLPGDEQDLGEVLRIELDRLVSLLHPADAIAEERAGAQSQATPARSSVDK